MNIDRAIQGTFIKADRELLLNAITRHVFSQVDCKSCMIKKIHVKIGKLIWDKKEISVQSNNLYSDSQIKNSESVKMRTIFSKELFS